MEVETSVEYEGAKRILELLEFRVKETYSKLREEYKLDGCTVCLDHIGNAGCFVQTEGSRRKIGDTARRLGLRPTDREHRSYRRLIKESAVADSRSSVGSPEKGRA
jgi:adenylate cyclase class IV